MAEPKFTAGRGGRQVELMESEKMRRERPLLLEVIENQLTEELLVVHYIRQNQHPRDTVRMLELAVRIFERKKERSVQEDAILAYARMRLRGLGK